MSRRPFTRRRFLGTTAAASAATIGFPYIRTSHAAGSLALGFWDHWVPGANDTLTKLCQDWGKKEKVDVKIDYITSQGNKNMLTITAESQARSGHDILAHPAWYALTYARQLEPLDDVMNPLIKQYGKVATAAEFLCKSGGKWIAVPAVTGTQVKPPCARLDLFKQHAGIDILSMYPVNKAPTKEADNWTWETMVVAAEKLKKAGSPIGLGIGQTTDSIDWVGAMFHSFGADLVDAKGHANVKTDAVKQVLDYSKRLVAAMPPDVFAWDDASNNKYLISGQGSMIMNPPSAYAVAKRDNPKVAAQCYTFEMPKGAKGRYAPFLPFLWALWGFSKNKSAGKSLLAHLLQRENVEKLVNASIGYDIPSFESMRDFKVWQQVEPPQGAVYHYPPRGTEEAWMACAPAPASIAQQMYTQSIMTKMIAKYTQGGEPMDKVLGWAASELEGYQRS
ncbi:MAG: extracellular solute-binding protein [Bradyrhizobium sp.]|nr:extracellular solute-binding protein [Bradyrhizobium sp.]